MFENYYAEMSRLTFEALKIKQEIARLKCELQDIHLKIKMGMSELSRPKHSDCMGCPMVCHRSNLYGKRKEDCKCYKK